MAKVKRVVQRVSRIVKRSTADTLSFVLTQKCLKRTCELSRREIQVTSENKTFKFDNKTKPSSVYLHLLRWMILSVH